MGVVCALLGAFCGCTAQLANDLGSQGYQSPTYLLTGIGIGIVIGALAAWGMWERKK